MNRGLVIANLGALAAAALLLAPTAGAGTISCDTLASNSEPDLTGYWADGTIDDPYAKTGDGYACEAIDPATADTGPGNSDLGNDSEELVNLHKFFEFDDWVQLERDNTPGDDPGNWLNIEPEGGANEGTWQILNPNFWSMYGTAMLVLKDGNLPGKYPDGCVERGSDKTCLRTAQWVGYLVTPGHLSGDWGWFDPAELSHATLYVREGSHDVPEPGTLGLLGLGLLGIGFGRRRLRS